jgi:RNA polymerase sigma factor for flagellar operon FliA
MSREEQFLEQLALIERLIGWVCSRRGLRGADAEDFASVVKLRLIENDYEVLARFEGRSSLKTYLVAVVNRIYLDYQVERFGKWRPSAQARRCGDQAMRLERLLYRDGLSLGEAYGVLRDDPAFTLSREDLHELSVRIPFRRGRPHFVSRDGEPVPAEAGAVPPDAERGERQAMAERAFAAIAASLRRLPDADRLFLRFNLEQQLTVAICARTLGREQKSLYRRREEIFAGIRGDLAAAGIVREDVEGLLTTLDWHAVFEIDAPGADSVRERDDRRPSQEHAASTRRGGGA